MDTAPAVIAEWLLRTTWQAGVLVALVGAVHLLVGRRLAPRWRFALWGLVVVRLLLPATPPSAWSVFNVPLPDSLASRDTDSLPEPVAAPSVKVRVVTTFTLPIDPATAPAPTGLPPAITYVAPREAAPAAPLDWRGVLLVAWAIGAALGGGRVFVGTVLMRRKLQRARAPGPDVLALLQRCHREMGVRAEVPALVTDAVAGPALFGFVRPVLLLPPGLLERLDASELRFVFLHELAHVKRRDPLTNAALLLAAALHWFNPLALLAVARCRAERELACDELVMHATAPAARPDYGRAVLRVAEAVCAARAGRACAAAVAAALAASAAPSIGLIPARSHLRRRIAMISSFRADARPGPRHAVLPVVLLLGVCSCALTDRKLPASAASSASAPATQPIEGRDRDEILANLIRTSRRLTADGRYDKALRVVDQMLAIDPGNDYAVGVRPLVVDRIKLGTRRHAQERKGKAPYDDILTSPFAWPDISAIREAGDADEAAAEANDRVLPCEMERALPEVTFDGVGLADVLDFLREVMSADIRTDWKALEAAGVTRETPVTARLRNMKFEKALQILLDQAGGEQANLGYLVDGAVLWISTAAEIERRRPVVTRVYDVRDLLVEISDFTDAPKLGVPAPAAPTRREADPPDDEEVEGKSREELVEEITTLIEESVDPDSWRDNGGSVGALRELQGQLIISQRDENHRQIVNLLEQLRETRAIQVSVEARFLTIDVEKLPDALREKLRQSFNRAGEPGRSVLTDEEVDAVLAGEDRAKDDRILTAPRMTLYNGQRAYVMVATDRQYVNGFVAVEKDGETRYEPQYARVSSGVLLDVAATSSADRKHVTLTLRPQLARLEGMKSVPFEGGGDVPAAKGLVVQVPHVVEQKLETTASVPDRNTLLLGGFVHTDGEPAAADGEPAPATRPARELFLLVKPTLIVTEPAK